MTSTFARVSLVVTCALSLACTAPATLDAGESDGDAGQSEDLDDGFSACGDDVCQPGTRCDADGCRPGCQFDAHCLSSEICDGSVCRPSGTRLCTDEDGSVACGSSSCAASTWCRDPAVGTCLDGCRSSANCPCGQVCTTTSAAGSGACTDPSGAPVCGDDACQPGETEASCPADCVAWSEECAEGCERYAFFECEDVDVIACAAACETSDEESQRNFVACVAGGGAAACSAACVTLLSSTGR